MSLEEFGNKKIESKSDMNADWVELEPDKNGEVTQWIVFGGDKFLPTGKTIKSLPAGVYFAKKDERSGQPFFQGINLKNDKLIEPPKGIISEVLEEIESFWKRKNLFDRYGFLHYRGYLFYGSHGSGKSSVVQLISEGVRRMGGIVVYCEDPEELVSGLNAFRKIEKDRPVVVVFEDIDAIIKKYGESKVLAYLDGESKISNVLNIATTNYPELLDKRIVNRPRRFDRIIKIEFPSLKARELYLSGKVEKKEFKEWLAKTEGLSFASLAELVIRVKCLGKGLDESNSLLREAQEKNISSEGDNKVGFDQEDEED